MLTGCNNSNNKGGTTFNPVEHESSLTDSEREAAIAAKRAEQDVNIDTLLYGHGVRFAIVQPKVEGDVTEDIANRISMKMLQIAAQNGISGVGNYTFVLGTEIAQTSRTATGTAPQKMAVGYDLTFKVMNTVTGDVYATAVQQVAGVGNTFDEANRNAVTQIKNTAAIQQMLVEASQRIIAWYEANTQTVRNMVERAEGEGDYALALAILNSIPPQATGAYKYVAAKQDALVKGMLHKQAADILAEMEAVITSSGDGFNPAVGAYFRLIPTDSPEHKKAQQLYADYERKCQVRRADVEARAERDSAAAREARKLQMLYDHEEELANIEADKIKSKYQSMASAKAAAAQSSSRPSGLFGSLGYAIGGTFERIFKVADTAGEIITSKMEEES